MVWNAAFRSKEKHTHARDTVGCNTSQRWIASFSLGNFCRKQLSLWQNFVVATLGHKFKLIWFCAFCCREDKILSRETKFFTKILQDKRRDLSPGRVTATYFTRTCRPTGTHGVLCRSDVLHRQVSDCVTTFNQARERGDVF